jgi:hypothetical protein
MIFFNCRAGLTGRIDHHRQPSANVPKPPKVGQIPLHKAGVSPPTKFLDHPKHHRHPRRRGYLPHGGWQCLRMRHPTRRTRRVRQIGARRHLWKTKWKFVKLDVRGVQAPRPQTGRECKEAPRGETPRQGGIPRGGRGVHINRPPSTYSPKIRQNREARTCPLRPPGGPKGGKRL